MSDTVNLQDVVVDNIKKEVVEPTYLQLISQDEKQQEKANLVIKAQEANLELSKTIIEMTQAAEILRQSLVKAKRAIPYNVKEEFKLAKQLSDIEIALQYALKVKETRFKDALV